MDENSLASSHERVSAPGLPEFVGVVGKNERKCWEPSGFMVDMSIRFHGFSPYRAYQYKHPRVVPYKLAIAPGPVRAAPGVMNGTFLAATNPELYQRSSPCGRYKES